MKMAKIEEVSEERDCRSRTSNIIVHGVKEEREEEEESTSRKDKIFISNLFGALEEKENQLLFIGRIEKQEADKNRPIKIALQNESEKKAIFKKLRLLKGKDEFKVCQWLRTTQNRNEKFSNCGPTRQRREAAMGPKM